MNPLIKRSMQLGLCALFIGAAVTPACAQKGKPPFKGGKPPMTGKGGAAGVPVVPKTPKTPPVKVSGYKRHQPVSTKDKPDLVSLNTLPEDVMPSDDLVSLNTLPESMMPSVEPTPVINTPVTDADRYRIEREMESHRSSVEGLQNYLQKQLTKKQRDELDWNVNKLVWGDEADEADFPLLLTSRDFEEWMSKHAPQRDINCYKKFRKDPNPGPTKWISEIWMERYCRAKKRTKFLNSRDFEEWMSKHAPQSDITYYKEFRKDPYSAMEGKLVLLIYEYYLEKQLTKRFNPHRVKLDEKGFPKYFISSSRFYRMLSRLAPKELAAYSENPEMIEVYAAKHPVWLYSADQAFVDFILEQRFNHVAIPITSPARDVLQVAYDYFEIQGAWGGYVSYSYSYRRDVPFEELTYAEKEGFIVHKLISYQLKNGDPKSMDVAHLRMLDYIASRKARPQYEKEPLLTEVVDQLRASLQAYQILSKDSQLNLENLEDRSMSFWRHDFKQVLKHADEKVIMDLYKLLPENLQQEFASTIMRMDAFKDQLQQELEQNAQQIAKELFDMLPSHVKKNYTKNILLKRNPFKQGK